MTIDRATRRVLVDLSVVSIVALSLALGWIEVAHVDAARASDDEGTPEVVEAPAIAAPVTPPRTFVATVPRAVVTATPSSPTVSTPAPRPTVRPAPTVRRVPAAKPTPTVVRTRPAPTRTTVRRHSRPS